MKSKPKPNFKSRWNTRQRNALEKNARLAHPVVRASYLWSVVSDQLSDFLGPEIHHRWFKDVKPLVLSHNVLILEVPHHFSAQWIHTHYHELVDVLLSVQDKKLSSFFVAQSERGVTQAKNFGTLLERPTTEVKSQAEDQESK